MDERHTSPDDVAVIAGSGVRAGAGVRVALGARMGVGGFGVLVTVDVALGVAVGTERATFPPALASISGMG